MSSSKIVRFNQENEPTLEELSTVVRGYIAVISLSPSLTMYVNEEAIPRRLAPNKPASELAQRPIFGRVALWHKIARDE